MAKKKNQVNLTVKLTFSDEILKITELNEIIEKTMTALIQAVESGNGLAPEDVGYTEIINVTGITGINLTHKFIG